ncbi:MAG: HD domain-containing protein [Bacteroidetes bacterium]|nr:MAG: HD domain-containing protein [Bacteroidota bacterium]
MKTNQQALVNQTIAYVKHELNKAEGGHDWWHIWRVWKLSVKIAQSEQADMLVVELGTLLHDIADSKFHDGDETLGPQKARSFLESSRVDESVIDHVVKIIVNISFSAGKEKQAFRSKELDIIQDADRLDALGAIGIARAFNYGGFKNREIFNPVIKPKLNMTKEEYKGNNAPTINHFYEKLLLLKDKMNTETGKKMAIQRHEFLEKFLNQFYEEWEGNL